jgi:hypothetical protein
MSVKRTRVVFWALVAGVVACAFAAGWAAFARLATLPPAELVQTSVSPDSRWALTTWFIGAEKLGHPEGVLRVDVSDLGDLRRASRTIYADPVPNRDATRRIVLWRDADHVALPLAGGGEAVLDLARIPDQATPGEFSIMVKATAGAAASLLAVLVAGVFGALLVNTWFLRREEARWEAWPVDRAAGRRRAAQG